MLEISFAPSVLPKSGALVLLARGRGEPGPLFAQADKAVAGRITAGLKVAAFKPDKERTWDLTAPGAGLSRITVVGAGTADISNAVEAEEIGGTIAAALAREAAVTVDASALAPGLCAALAGGMALRSYRFDRYRTREKDEDKPRLRAVTILCDDPPAARAAWPEREAVVAGVCLARDLVSEPANVLTPAEMAKRCEALEDLGLKVQVHGAHALERLGFGALLGVAQGSDHPPRMVVLQWHGAAGGGSGKEKGRLHEPLAFIGKGVTFDSGGISLKPAAGMEEMKYDMAGAAAVVGLMAALARRKAKVDAVGLIGLVENMPGPTAQRPGDVVKTCSGQTVEVINTDAEGRLVLADLLWHCQEKFRPRLMVDLATLTGAIVVGLGHEYAGLFSNDDGLAEKLSRAGNESGEKLWRMPLNPAYDKLIKSDIADMKNTGGRPGGSITAAQFLQRFVNGKAWAHLDIAGTAWAAKDQPVTPKGATAFGVRLLDRMVADSFES